MSSDDSEGPNKGGAAFRLRSSVRKDGENVKTMAENPRELILREPQYNICGHGESKHWREQPEKSIPMKSHPMLSILLFVW
nr:hypothetical protein Itr_chr08CG13550 [Ipomoea trifida]